MGNCECNYVSVVYGLEDTVFTLCNWKQKLKMERKPKWSNPKAHVHQGKTLAY